MSLQISLYPTIELHKISDHTKTVHCRQQVKHIEYITLCSLGLSLVPGNLVRSHIKQYFSLPVFPLQRDSQPSWLRWEGHKGEMDHEPQQLLVCT